MFQLAPTPKPDPGLNHGWFILLYLGLMRQMRSLLGKASSLKGRKSMDEGLLPHAFSLLVQQHNVWSGHLGILEAQV